MNLETWAYIHHLFFAEKFPKKLIARKLGLDIKTIRQALAYNALGHDYLKNIILANRRKQNTPAPLGTPSSRIDPDLVRSTWVEERNPGIYDDHFHTQEPAHES